MDQIKDSKLLYRSALLLNEQARKTEIKEIAVDSPETILTWDGCKEIYWMVNLESGLYVMKDLSSIKHFFAEEAFACVPDPLNSKVLLGIKCPLFVLNLEKTGSSASKCIESYAKQYLDQRVRYTECESSGKKLGPQIEVQEEAENSNYEYVLGTKADHIDVKGHKRGPSVQENTSQVPTIVIPFQSEVFHQSSIPTEYRKNRFLPGPVDQIDDDGSEFSASLAKSRTDQCSESQKFHLNQSPLIYRLMAANQDGKDVHLDVSHTIEKGVLQTPNSQPHKDSESIPPDKGAALAIRYYDRVLNRTSPGSNCHSPPKSSEGISKKKKQSKKKRFFSKSSSKERTIGGNIASVVSDPLFRNSNPRLGKVINSKVELKKPKKRTRSLSRSKDPKASCDLSKQKNLGMSELDKCLSEAYQIFRKKMCWEPWTNKEDAASHLRLKQHILNAI